MTVAWGDEMSNAKMELENVTNRETKFNLETSSVARVAPLPILSNQYDDRLINDTTIQ
jgi:hypothetical protein